jgi:hypothetical protein
VVVGEDAKAVRREQRLHGRQQRRVEPHLVRDVAPEDEVEAAARIWPA